VNGSTILKVLNGTAKLGPGAIGVTLDLTTGAFTGDLTLPPTTVNFNLFGFLPGTASIKLIPSGAVTGTFGAGIIHATSKETVDLTSVTLFGFPILPPGSNCATTSPATIPLVSNAGFNPSVGGTLTGTYTLPTFAGCGFFTPFISAFSSGAGNTLSVNLSNPH
jgi:hypothetical protein